MVDKKIKGTWWRLDTPDQKLPGEIIYGATIGATVDLFGHIYEGFGQPGRTQRFTLQGLTLNNKPITLFECVVRKATDTSRAA